jgi:Asp-tRNA(Asn)/Glu-tRNA(Gln) amidotransferase B subunit
MYLLSRIYFFPDLSKNQTISERKFPGFLSGKLTVEGEFLQNENA